MAIAHNLLLINRDNPMPQTVSITDSIDTAAPQILSALQSANIAFRSIRHADYPQAIGSRG